MLIVGSIVIRVRDLGRQLEFWTAALSYEPRHPIQDDFAVLEPADGIGPCVSLDTMPSERILPPRMHLDLYAEDQTAEVRRLTTLGAAEVHWDGRPVDADYVIMEDPEGNRFCVIDARDWPGWTTRRPDAPSPA